MSKPFDATTKFLVEMQPSAWLEFAGLPPAPVEIISADLATITTEADQVLKVHDPDEPYLLHIEFQAGYDAWLDRRVLRYSVLLDDRHHLIVESVVILLRPEAERGVTGRVQRRRKNGHSSLDFTYTVIRLWELPVESILQGSLGLLPLAPLTDVTQEALPGVVQQMQTRIEQEATPAEAKSLWAATYVLMGLKYAEQFTNQLLRGVQQMKESVTYQAILREGEAKGKTEATRGLILRLGEKRFGAPDAATQKTITAIRSVKRLEALAERLLEVENWTELLQKD